MNKQRIVVLGAGFGGLELSTVLSETFGDSVDVTLIDKNDAFVFGYSKLDVMFGHATLDEAYHEPSLALRADKDAFGSSRRARWFGM